MGPVEKWEGDEHEQVQSRDRVRNQCVKRLVIWPLDPTQGKGQPDQEDMDREQERRNHSASTEQCPKKGREVLDHLVTQENPHDNAGKNRAPDVVRTGDDPIRNPLVSQPYNGDCRRQVEPSNSVIKHGYERYAV